MMKNSIVKLSKTQVESVTSELNNLLADYQIFYQNMRGLHWNIKGKNFFELHLKFEEIYTDAQDKIDLIAERILTLEQIPLHTFATYLKHATIPVGEAITNDDEAVKLIVTSLEILLEKELKLLAITAEYDDEGTNSLLSDFIVEQEKMLWMFKAWLS